MIKTQIQKVFAAIALFAIATANFGAAHATQIGTGSVTSSGAFDTAINWNDTFTTASASGTISNILIKARVLPTLNMEISVEEIDLGVLVPGTASTGSLSIEVGTNAVSGISITARSQNGGLENTSDANVKISNETTALDPVASEAYTWGSTINGTDDSSFTGAGGYTSNNTAGNPLSTVPDILVANIGTEYNVYTTNKPEAKSVAIDDVTFDVSATAQAETPAGEYEDYATFTVTGNF